MKAIQLSQWFKLAKLSICLSLTTIATIALVACHGEQSTTASSTTTPSTPASPAPAAPGLGNVGSTGGAGTSPAVSTLSLSAPQYTMVSVAANFSISFPSGITVADAQWNFGDGSALQSGIGPVSYKYFHLGLNTLTVVVTEATGQKTTFTQDITVIPYNESELCVSDIAISVPASGTVGAPISTSVTIPSCLSGAVTAAQWNFGDGTTPLQATSAQHSYGTPDTYKVTLTLSTTTGENFTLTAMTAISAPTGGGTTTTIQQFQPALSVRDVSCLACHANIQATLITDFGYSDPWFMNGYNNPTAFGQTHYTANTWQLIQQIEGQVIVPDTSLPASFVQSQLHAGSTLNPASTVSLLTYLGMTDIENYGGGWYSYFAMPLPSTTSFTNNVKPPAAGLTPIIAKNNIYIGAPTAAEIVAIAASSRVSASSSSPWVQVKGLDAGGLAGLTLVTGVNGQSYISTTGPINCSGRDVVVSGTLLINNGQFYAEHGGCRLYVTGTVFIEGPITYLNSGLTSGLISGLTSGLTSGASGATPDPTSNLQITSATAIMMGVGLNGEALNGDGSIDDSGQTPLAIRLLSDVRSNLLLRSASTAAAYQSYASGILAEGENIGESLLQDASVPGNLPTALSAAKQARASVQFQHLLLNAPLVHSRYMGEVSGVIVAESAMFSLGEFHFSYDPVFATVPILPALPYDIVCTGTPCNPTQP